MSCCPIGSEPALAATHKDQGKVITLGEDALPAYVVGSSDSRAAVVVIYDIYGFEGYSRIRLICDQLAQAGYYVVLPDVFRGDSWGKQADAGKTNDVMFPWIQQFPWEGKLEKDFAAAIAHAKSQPGVQKIGIAGFCFGGFVALHGAATGELQAAYSAHPSTKIAGPKETELASKVQCPVRFDTAGNDPANLKAGGEVFKALQGVAAPFGEAMVTEDHPDMTHGWTTRGDLTDPKIAADVAKTMKSMHAFFGQHLLDAQQPITLGASGVTFTNVAREWRCKYMLDENGGPHNSKSLAAAEALLQANLETLKALPNAKVSRIVCGGCGDFKVVIEQPAKDHGAWSEQFFAPEADFLQSLGEIQGVSAVEAQEYTIAEL